MFNTMYSFHLDAENEPLRVTSIKKSTVIDDQAEVSTGIYKNEW